MRIGKFMNRAKYITRKREPFFEIAKDYIKEDSLVLDIGPGNGHFSEFCGRSDFYLFEGNSDTVSLLSQRYKNVFYGRLPTLPFENDFFDVIHCSHVIEHLQPQEFYDTVKEMDRCLKVGGKLIISTPLYWDGFYDDLSHIKPYNPAVFKNYLCSGHENSRTRPLISSSYKIERLQYRYREKNVLRNNYHPSKNFWVSHIVNIFDKLRTRGLKFYTKTGYTLVVVKGYSE